MAEPLRRPSLCPRCDLPAGPGLRYCGRCGLDLDRGDPATPSRAAQPTGPAPLYAEPIPIGRRDPDSDLRDPLVSVRRGGGRLALGFSRPKSIMNAPALAMLVMGLAATVGALLAWFTVAGAEVGNVTRSGLDMGAFGTLTLVAGIALALSGAARALHAGSLALVQLVGLVAAIALLATFAWEFMAMDSVARSMIGTGSGIAGLGVGLLLVLVAGLGGVVFVGLISHADA